MIEKIALYQNSTAHIIATYYYLGAYLIKYVASCTANMMAASAIILHYCTRFQIRVQ